MEDLAFVNLVIRDTLFTNRDLPGPLASRCTCGELVRAVYTENAIWVYEPTLGSWRSLEDPQVHTIIIDMKQRVEQQWIAMGQPETFELPYKRMNSLRSFIQDRIYTREFFNDSAQAAFFTNGVFHANGGEPTLPCHHNRLRHPLKVACTNTETPLWDAMLDRVFAGETDAEDKKLALHEFFGAALTGVAPLFKKVLIFVGEGRNGKSTVQSVLEAMFPPELISHSNPQTWHEDYARAELVGKRLNITSELPERELLESEALKTIVEGGAIQARRIREKKFEFRPVAAHIFATNSLIRTNDHSEGFFRRFCIMPFNNQFSGAVDPTPPILANELPGIAWKCVQAVRAAVERGYQYTVPPSTIIAIQQWKEESNPIANFLSSCCTTSEEARFPARSLFKLWEGWAQDTGNKPCSVQFFGKKVKQILGKDVAIRTSNGVYYKLKMSLQGMEVYKHFPFPSHEHMPSCLDTPPN